MARAPITPQTSDAALDDVTLRFRRGSLNAATAPAALVEADLPIIGVGQETVTRAVSAIPAIVFTRVVDANPKQLFNKQLRSVLEWLRDEAGLTP